MESRGSQERCEQNEIARLTQMKSKVNRLRRSPKAATLQLGQTRNTAEFKTPTRPARGQFRRLIPDDSPSNDPDSHQDIIWDTTSPSPIRHGRGQRRAANVRAVDISDIANRIAPKNGRLEEADSSLLQWIGDSAVPCTPEVQQPKVKQMSARQSTVEDLMRLAKQFDFNMRQDEAQEQNPDAPGSKQAEPPHPDQCTTAHYTSATESAALKPSGDDERGLQQEMDDDLDFLFDGPTQRLSGRLSQTSSYRTQDVPERNGSVTKLRDSQKGTLFPTTANHGSTRANNAADDFDDDWSSDGLLDDSLLLEMTQNPDLFAAPRSSSTQKQTQNTLSAVTTKAQEALNCGTFQEQKTKREQTSQLDSQTQTKPYEGLPRFGNQAFSMNKVLSGPPTRINADQNQQYQRKTQVQPLQVVQNSSEYNIGPSTRHLKPNTKETPPSIGVSTVKPPRSEAPSMHQTHNPNPGGVKQSEKDADTGLEDDLDSFFASDDIWDDGVEDDDLFCEACDNLEEISATNSQHDTTKPPQNKPDAASQENVFAHPFPPKRPTANVSMSSANTSASSQYGQKAHALNSGPAGRGSNVSCDATRPSGFSSNGPYKFKQVRSSSAVGQGTCAAATQQGQERGVLAVLQSDQFNNHQFKKPYSDPLRSTPGLAKDLCSSAAVRCSEAEIERKKQQAMERRRLKMLANQNLRAPF